MKFIIETVSGRKGIKNFSDLNEYVNFMTKNGHKIKTIIESDLPYNDKPVKLPKVSTSKGWEQLDASAFGDIASDGEKGDCLLPNGNKGVFKDNAKFETSKVSEKEDSAEAPKVEKSSVKNSNASTESDLPKFKYEDSESKSKEEPSKEPKEESEDKDKDEDKKEIKESVEDNTFTNVVNELYDCIIDQLGEEAFDMESDVDSTLWDAVVDFGSQIDGYNDDIKDEYIDALIEKHNGNNLEEGFKDGWKKAKKFAKGAIAGAAMAGALAGNAHGMEDPYYDGATQPYETSYEDVMGDSIEINGYTYSKEDMKRLQKEHGFNNEEMMMIINGEDPYYDGATRPFEDDEGIEESVDFDSEIKESLKAAGVEITEDFFNEPTEEQLDNEEDGVADEKSGKTKLFEEDPLEEAPMSDEDFDSLEDGDKINWDLKKYDGNYTVRKDGDKLDFISDTDSGNWLDQQNDKDYVTKYFSKGTKEEPAKDSLEYALDQVRAWKEEKMMADYDDSYGSSKRLSRAYDQLSHWKKEVEKRRAKEEGREGEETLEETKPARYNQHLGKNKSFANISASRSNDELELPGKEKEKQKQSEDNNKKTEQLKKDIKDLGLSYIKTYGAWRDEGPVTQEDSFLIPDISKEQALELGKKYGQYSVIFKDEGEDTAYMYITLDNEDFGKKDMSFDMSKDAKFSQVKQGKEELEPYSGWTGLKKGGKGYNLSYKAKDED